MRHRFLSLLVAIAGILLYAFAANPKLQEVGRISFGCGLLAFLLQRDAHRGADGALKCYPSVHEI